MGDHLGDNRSIAKMVHAHDIEGARAGELHGHRRSTEHGNLADHVAKGPDRTTQHRAHLIGPCVGRCRLDPPERRIESTGCLLDQ
ncbi:MAG: hypothetical protein HYR89_08325 [Actinobacteria bacterium]|nr:hypothetical protein [Actinomycetota bacterium]MBI3256541.1 hypothetical protein [Actinomycetota bacterium]